MHLKGPAPESLSSLTFFAMFLSRGAKSQLGTNLELVLSHLDWLHKICQEQEDLSCKFRAFFF